MGEKMTTKVRSGGVYEITPEEAEAGEQGTCIVQPTAENPNPGVLPPEPPKKEEE